MTALAPRPRVRVMVIAHAADLWLGELARQGKSARTIDTYRRLTDNLADAYTHIDVDELTITMLRRFLDSQAVNRKTGGRCSDSTVAQKVSIICCFFKWLYDEDYIPADPAYRLQRPKLTRPEENDGIVSVSSDEARRMLDACQTWREKLCLHILVYTGGRRRAVANLRLSDYDPAAGEITFREKGGKTITKPVPGKLGALIDEAFIAGVWNDAGDDPWLIPPRGHTGWAAQDKYGVRRDDRIVYRTVKEIADRAGVRAHVHAMRAAFAVLFLEQKPNQVVALKDLMGHARLETTQLYLRRLDRRRSMEVVRDLDWGETGSAREGIGAETRHPSSAPGELLHGDERGVSSAPSVVSGDCGAQEDYAAPLQTVGSPPLGGEGGIRTLDGCESDSGAASPPSGGLAGDLQARVRPGSTDRAGHDD